MCYAGVIALVSLFAWLVSVHLPLHSLRTLLQDQDEQPHSAEEPDNSSVCPFSAQFLHLTRTQGPYHQQVCHSANILILAVARRIYVPL